VNAWLGQHQRPLEHAPASFQRSRWAPDPTTRSSDVSSASTQSKAAPPTPASRSTTQSTTDLRVIAIACQERHRIASCFPATATDPAKPRLRATQTLVSYVTAVPSSQIRATSVQRERTWIEPDACAVAAGHEGPRAVLDAVGGADFEVKMGVRLGRRTPGTRPPGPHRQAGRSMRAASHRRNRSLRASSTSVGAGDGNRTRVLSLGS
jgi:hypothetical protein